MISYDKTATLEVTNTYNLIDMIRVVFYNRLSGKTQAYFIPSNKSKRAVLRDLLESFCVVSEKTFDKMIETLIK